MTLWIALLGLSASFAFDAHGATVCPDAGRFHRIVEAAVGTQTAATKTSYGLALVDRATGTLICEESVNPEMNVYPASTFKTLVAFKVLEDIDAGRVSLDDRIAISQVNANQECAKTCATYGKGKLVSVSRLLEDMITVSSNIATNQLIDLVGKPALNDLAIRLGAPTLKVRRKVYDSVNPEPEIQERNEASASGLVALYREIVSGRLGILSRESRELLIAVLGRQKINGSLNGNFPAGVKFYHKTGNTSEVTGDGGFYYLDGRTAAVLVGLQAFTSTRICPARGLDRACETVTGFESLRRVGRATYESLKRP